MKRVRKQVNDAVTYMKEYGGITNADAEQIGIKNLSAVICRIRKMGIAISTIHVTEIVRPNFWQWLCGKRTQNIDRRMYVISK